MKKKDVGILALIVVFVAFVWAPVAIQIVNGPDYTTQPPEPEPAFTELVQESLRGVVHLQAPDWQASGFVVGPRLIVTARHCVEDVEDFVLTTYDGHQVRATRAISDKKHDVGFIWVDDLTCIAEERGTARHSVVLNVLPLGSIKDVCLVQDVYVIGSSYGFENFNAVSRGIISGLGRDWDEVNPRTGKTYGWSVCFTSDSSASSGNSGGPIFTMDGVVRGFLLGGYNSTVNCFMPCDLFLSDLVAIELMFAQDRYQREEKIGYDNYNYLRGEY